jgi:hypothetical protein
LVLDSSSGHNLPSRGYGALSGKIAFRSDIDLTLPIYEQVMKLDSRRKRPTFKKNVA